MPGSGEQPSPGSTIRSDVSCSSFGLFSPDQLHRYDQRELRNFLFFSTTPSASSRDSSLPLSSRPRWDGSDRELLPNGCRLCQPHEGGYPARERHLMVKFSAKRATGTGMN